MSTASSRGILVYGRDAQRRNTAAALVRASAAFAPVRVASHMAEAAKCFADTAVQVVVVVDDVSAVDAVRTLAGGLSHTVHVYHCATDDDLRNVLAS